MYLVLVPVERLNSARGDYYEANYMTDPIEVSRALSKYGVIAYKLDALTEIKEIEIEYTEVVADGRR